ncbi:isopentenyl-diphosphate Delta-isomerase [Flexithrix dorotheae]|uniref:isopentenyl-diphosphate Delta-isomerase n=1 Tax=Flexithrix dorotheae TaxID=70993 RepID=UPI00036A472F|nr:isopentenyl-diphosphate Delta-isomerase [Flexithrix dorotheae]
MTGISVICVDKQNNEIGEMSKKEVHEKGILHRAFSIFIFNSKGQLLLQQRAKDKYHSGGLWTNTCCSHPAPGENTLEAANRRLMEEMGMHTHLEHVFDFTYTAHFENGLIENEYDHVFFGFTDELPSINKEEVENWKLVNFDELDLEISENSNHFTAWFKIIYPKVKTHFQTKLQ